MSKLLNAASLTIPGEEQIRRQASVAAGPALASLRREERATGFPPAGVSARLKALGVSLAGHAVLLFAALCLAGPMAPDPGGAPLLTVDLLNAGPGAPAGGGHSGKSAATSRARSGAAATAQSRAAAVRDPAAAARGPAQTPPRAEASGPSGETPGPAGSAAAQVTSGAGGTGAGAGTGNGTGNASGSGAGNGAEHGTGTAGAGGAQVDALPRILSKVKPLYPEQARRQRRTGIVTLRFLVDAEGHVRQPSVVEATPPGLFEESALSAIGRWRFAPALRQGRPVPTWLVLPVRFTLEQ
jgi:TonB family protein